MRAYAVEQVSTLLDRLVFQASRAARMQDPRTLRDFHEAAQRFRHGLRAFAQFFPGRQLKKIRRRLRRLLSLTTGIRHREVALKLRSEAGFASDDGLARKLARERTETQQRLTERLVRFAKRDVSSKWRARLEL